MSSAGRQFHQGSAWRKIPFAPVPVIGAVKNIARAARERREVSRFVGSIAVRIFSPIAIEPAVAALVPAELSHRIGHLRWSTDHRRVGLETDAVVHAGPRGIIEPGLRPIQTQRAIQRHGEFSGRARGQQRARTERYWNAVRDVWHLQRVSRGIGRLDGSVRLEQREIFAGVVQSKIGVQRPAGHPAIFARSEHHDETVQREVRGGETPARPALRIGERPTAQVHRVGAGVKNLDPIRGIAVLVVQRVVVLGHELGDEQVVQGPRRISQRAEQAGEEEKQLERTHNLHTCDLTLTPWACPGFSRHAKK